MELEILKKKISSYRTEKGRITKIPDELAVEILYAWEQWTGPTAGFYSAIGVDFRKAASIIGRGKRLKREGHFPVEEFKEVKLESAPTGGYISDLTGAIELSWDQGKVIRFPQVDQLIDFLKKVA